MSEGKREPGDRSHVLIDPEDVRDLVLKGSGSYCNVYQAMHKGGPVAYSAFLLLLIFICRV